MRAAGMRVEAARRTLMGVVAAALSVLLLGTATGCSPRPCADVSGDCVSLFDFEGRSYSMAPTQVVESVPVGESVGTGTMDPCPGEDPACVTPTDRDVFAFSGVPAKQAIVLTNAAGDGFAYIVTKKPAGGWDAALADYMERARVRMPRPRSDG